MIKFDTEKLAKLCAEFLPLDALAEERLNTYGNLLIKWNEKMNLTAITEPEEVLYKHFYDCLLFFKHVGVPQNAKIIDVGTGAGFPGMVLLIARPDIKLTLLDSLNKRLVFLNAVLEETGLSAEVIHARAEEGARKDTLREQFDISCARAVAALPTLSEYCLPYVKKGGLFVSMKGPAADEEAVAAERALSVLGGGKAEIISEKLPDGSERRFVKIKKISQTPTKYPRASGKITKQPL